MNKAPIENTASFLTFIGTLPLAHTLPYLP
jgi:hypothetical protein